jgi:PAS domain S-box-containing protein/diguanylate cyclase (GGDEF)-like protein
VDKLLDIKIMIVEDEEDLRDLLFNILKREVKEVQTFSKPSEALEAYKEFSPDIIVTDIQMPGMNGLEMADIIRKLYGNVPIIILSAYREAEYFIKAIDLKIYHFLTKPVDIDKLIKEITEITEKLKISSELKQQTNILNQYKHIVDVSNPVTITDKSGRITYTNDKFCELSGYSREELIGQMHNIVRHPDVPKELYVSLWKTIFSKQVWQRTIKNKSKNGKAYYVDATIAPILDKNDNIMEFISIKTDITTLLLNEKKLQYQLMTDSLTLLPNRVKLQEEIKAQKSVTLMILDINHFKEVNLLYGLQVGDKALLYITKVMQKLCLSFGNLSLYRISSDEFGVLKANDCTNTFREIISLINKYLESNPFEYDDITVNIDITCSIAFKEDESQNLLESAHEALDLAKKAKEVVHIYNKEESRQNEYQKNFQWTKKVKEALLDGRIKAYFQPIYNVNAKKILKYEALVRLIEIDGSVVSPFFFLEIAKRSRLYNEITKTMIIQACKTFQNRPEGVNVNLSIEDLSDTNTVTFFIETVKQYSMQGRVTAEVLESEGVESFENFSQVLQRLKENQINVAIDDFGSGYSNFAYLTNLTIDVLKIDGSLVKNVVKDANSRIIVQSIAMFAHELGMETVAEFVSDKDIFESIKNIGVDYVQGYYLSEPLAEPLPLQTVLNV